VQAQFPIHRAAHIGFPPLRVLHQRAALDALRERTAVELPLAAFLWLEAMQLAVMPAERADADQPRVIWLLLPSHSTGGKHPGVYTVHFPDLCQLFPRFLEPQLFTQFLGFVALFDLDRSQLAEFLVEPVLAHLQRRKTAIPATLVQFGLGFDVFHHKDAHREELAQKRCQAQFPVPTCSGGRREFLLALLAILTWLATRGVAPSAGAAPLGAALFRFLHAVSGLRLDVGIGVGGSGHAIAFALATRVNPHRNRLQHACRRFDIQPDAKEPSFPEMRRLAAFDPLPGSGRSSGHEWVAFLIDHRDEDVRHRAVSLFRVCYGPFAADHRSGCKLGRRSQRPVGCHARMVQLPSVAPLPRLGQASFAVALVGSPVASRIASQAHPVEQDGCLTTLKQ
jgi:hypothetical protein